MAQDRWVEFAKVKIVDSQFDENFREEFVYRAALNNVRRAVHASRSAILVHAGNRLRLDRIGPENVLEGLDFFPGAVRHDLDVGIAHRRWAKWLFGIVAAGMTAGGANSLMASRADSRSP